MNIKLFLHQFQIQNKVIEEVVQFALINKIHF